MGRTPAKGKSLLPRGFPALPSDFQSIIEDQNQPLDQRLVTLMSEALKPPMDSTDPEVLKCENSLHEFTRQAWHILEPVNPFVDGWHIGCICAHLEAVTNLDIRNLIINIPPRHGKSLIVSVMWFVWSWLKKPGSRWLFSSYAAHLSERDSEKCRTLIKSPWFQSRWPHRFHIKATEDTRIKFVNNHEGYRVATSAGGVGAGEGGDYIINDDPTNTKEIVSMAVLERAIRYWDQTISTRGNNPNTMCKVIVMQRLAENDLSGHIMSENREYDTLILPAEYEPSRYTLLPASGPGREEGSPAIKKRRDAITLTSLQRAEPRWRDNPEGSGRFQEGDPLWPDQFGTEALRRLKAELRAVGTAGQLQQRPSPEKGAIFQTSHFRYALEYTTSEGLIFVLDADSTGHGGRTVSAHTCRCFQTIDTALKTSDTSAWTVVSTFCLTPCRRLIVWDVWRERVLVPEQYTAIMQLRAGKGTFEPSLRRWIIPGAANPWPFTLMYQAVEEKASGIGLIQQAAMEGKPFRILKAEGDKIMRASSLATMFEAGLVYFRAAARTDWLTDAESELLGFPSGTYKDIVDTFSYGAMLATQDSLTTAYVQGDLIADGGQHQVPDFVKERQEQADPGVYWRDPDIMADEDDDRDPWWRR